MSKTKLLSYHGDQSLKDKMVSEMKAHKDADRISQGEWFDDSKNKGCHIGCCGQSLGLTSGQSNFTELSEKLGFPKWFTQLQEAIFEGLPSKQAVDFSSEILGLIPVGKDIDLIRHMVEISRLKRLKEIQKKNNYSGAQEVIDAIDLCIECWRSDDPDWDSARSAAESAAESAADSAESAAWSAESARSAAESAWSAAWSAESAARSAAWSAERDTLYDSLIWLSERQEQV